MEHYVKFMRGSMTAFNKIPPKDRNEDTLYFITDVDNNVSLYLGNKLISSGEVDINLNNFSLDSLLDVSISNGLENNTLLIYKITDDGEGIWTNIPFNDDSLRFIGANSVSSGRAGFVPPPPEAGMTNLFLRSDGQWASIPTGDQGFFTPDGYSIDIYNNQFSLKNYGKKYYRYDEQLKEFIPQEVNNNYPWKEGLEPRVVKENNQFILGWFEPISEEILNLKNNFDELENFFNDLKAVVGDKENNSGLFFELNKTEDSLKNEIDLKISQALLSIGSLKRVIVSSIDDIDIQAEDSEQYIYMIADENSINGIDRYQEYVVINFDGVKQIERLGTWETNLDNYVQKNDLLFSTLDEINFEVKDKKLILKDISISKITNLENILNSINYEDGKTLSSNDFTDDLFNKLSNILEINSVNENEFEIKNNQLNILSIQPNQVNGLSVLLEEKVSINRLETELNSITSKIENVERRLIWVDLDEE